MFCTKIFEIFIKHVKFFPIGLLIQTECVKVTESNVTKVEEFKNPSTVTRYIYIENLDNPVKVFRETAV